MPPYIIDEDDLDQLMNAIIAFARAS